MGKKTNTILLFLTRLIFQKERKEKTEIIIMCHNKYWRHVVFITYGAGKGPPRCWNRTKSGAALRGTWQRLCHAHDSETLLSNFISYKYTSSLVKDSIVATFIKMLTHFPNFLSNMIDSGPLSNSTRDFGSSQLGCIPTFLTVVWYIFKVVMNTSGILSITLHTCTFIITLVCKQRPEIGFI